MSIQTIEILAPNLSGELQLHFRELVRRKLSVVRVEAITPAYRRIVLGGDGLTDEFPIVDFAPCDHVKVYFPDPATGELVSYREEGDDWVLEGEGTPLRRDYTPIAWDPATRELTLDFILHDSGVAGPWARDAAPGDQVVVIGPRANWLLPENYAHYLAVGDHTALPAIARLVAEAPKGARMTVLVEVPDAADQQQLATRDGLEVQWVHRNTAVAQEGHGSALESALRALRLPEDLDGLYAFAAGEATAMKGIRRYLRREVGLPKRQVHADGYWKRGIEDFDHHTNEVGED